MRKHPVRLSVTHIVGLIQLRCRRRCRAGGSCRARTRTVSRCTFAANTLISLQNSVFRTRGSPSAWVRHRRARRSVVPNAPEIGGQPLMRPAQVPPAASGRPHSGAGCSRWIASRFEVAQPCVRRPEWLSRSSFTGNQNDGGVQALINSQATGPTQRNLWGRQLSK